MMNSKEHSEERKSAQHTPLHHRTEISKEAPEESKEVHETQEPAFKQKRKSEHMLDVIRRLRDRVKNISQDQEPNSISPICVK